MLVNQKITYYAAINADELPGVAKKIKDTVKACKDLGHQASYCFISRKSVDQIKLARQLLTDTNKIIIIRYDLKMQLFLYLSLWYSRVKGKKIIIDIPTPRAVTLKEVNISSLSTFKKNVIKLCSLFSASWVLFPANRIIQYADEHPWFSLGVKHKTTKLGNGIYIDESYPLVRNQQKQGRLNLIAVASLADWHGYDRLIRAIAYAKQMQPILELNLKIVGDGQIRSELEKLTERLKLTDCITFTGFLSGEALTDAFDNINIGVTSLGLYRKGLKEASDLKTREYCARGLCVIGAGRDPDFQQDSPYRFVVPNNDEIDELARLLLQLCHTQLPRPEEVRKFAENHLSFHKKLQQILNFD